MIENYYQLFDARLCIENDISGKNRNMAKTLDYIFASIVLSLVTFAWATFAFKNWIGALIFSCAFTAVAIFTVSYVQKKKAKPYSWERLELEFCLRGNEYAIKTLLRAIKNADFDNSRNYILLENGIIIANFKFSPLGASDVASACNLAAKHEKNEIFLFAKGIDRKAYQIANLEKIKLNLIKTKQIFRFLAKRNALPDLKKMRTKFYFRSLAETMLNRRNFKNYAFSGGILILVSFITPLKIYYIVLGTLTLLMALLTLTPLGNGSITSPKVFTQLERELEDEYKRE